MQKLMMVKRIHTFIALLLVGILLLTGCNLPGSDSKLPATPTAAIQIPLVTVAATDTAVEVIEESTPTLAEIELTATAELAADDEGEAEATVMPTATIAAVEVVGATPTYIPTNNTANPDPTVYFTDKTTCYVSADTDSAVSGTVSAGMALAALDREGNFYRVNHPTQAGVLCWVTGSGISPNGAAFNLGN